MTIDRKIEILETTKFMLDKNHKGLCKYIYDQLIGDETFEDIELFTYNNIPSYINSLDCKDPCVQYWWPKEDLESRVAFLDYLIDQYKLLNKQTFNNIYYD